MKAAFPVIDWPGLLRSTMARSLALSLALHIAAIGLLRPAPGGDGRRELVIQARLMDAEANDGAREAAPLPPEAPPMPVESLPPEETPVLEETPAPLETPPLLTALTPSPEPPIPQAGEKSADMREEPPLPARPETSSESPAPEVAAARPGPADVAPLPSLPLGIDDTWYVARQVDRHPRAIGRIEPVYPEDARRRNLEGTLKLMLRIDPRGRVLYAEVVEAIPPGVFDAAALAAFRTARFEPALRDGRPVRYVAYIRVDFQLSD
jgi:periplasmic protein TonB